MKLDVNIFILDYPNFMETTVEMTCPNAHSFAPAFLLIQT